MNQANAREELQWGVNAFHAGYLGKAIQSFEEALRLYPGDLTVKNWLARTYFRLGFEDTALTMWKDLTRAGRPSPLLDYLINAVEMRRGLGRELSSPDIFVVSHELDSSRPETGYFKRPSSVYCMPDGKYFIVAYGSNEIISLNANSLLLSRFRGGLELIDHPFDIITDGSSFYVSEFEGNLVTQFDKNFVRLKSIGGKGIGDGKLLGPQYLALDAFNYLYVSDWGNRRVSKFDPDGNYVLSFGKNPALYPFEKLMPTGIAIKNGRVYVSDQFKKQVVVFDMNGNFLEAYGEGVLSGPEGLEFYDEDTLLVADGARIMGLSIREQIWKVWADVSPRARRLMDLSLTPNNDILAADFDANKVLVISEASSLYSGYFVQVQRVDSRNFPEVSVDISVEDILGRPIVGLTPQNLFVTEGTVPVQKTFIAVTNTDPQALSVVVLVEDSPALDKFDKELGLCIENIMGVLGKNSRIKIVFAREQATLESEFGSFDAARISALIAARGNADWKVDTGVRAAVTELLPERGRKAVVFLSSGELTERSFGLYTLQEIAANLRNNGVRFYPVYLGSLGKNPELEYVVQETRGQSYNFFNPEGLRNLFSEIEAARGSTYVVRYTSPTNSEFGRKFIPLEVQVLLYKKSGRDESGYYGPLVTK